MSIFSCLGKGFSISKSSLPLVLALFVFGFVWAMINLPFANPANPAEPSTIAAVLGFVFILISIFVQAGTIGYVQKVAKQGSSDFGAFTQAGAKNYFKLLGLAIIVGLIMVILAVLAVLGFVAGGNQAAPNPIAVIVGVVLAILAVIVLLFFFFAPYAAIVDGKGVIGSIKASMSLVKRNFFKVLGLGLLLVVIGFAVGFVLGLVMGLLAGALQGTPGQVVGSLFSSAINAYLGVVTTGAFMALYLSLTESYQAPTV